MQTPTLEERMFEQGFITPKEAASRTGFNQVSILRMVEREKIEHQRVGRFWFIRASALADHFSQSPMIQKEILKDVPGTTGAKKKPAARRGKKVA